MPLSVIFVGMVVFNNLCLKYVEVSFYQVARSLTILCNIALTYVVLGKSTSPLALAGCGVVVAGFVLGFVQHSASKQIESILTFIQKKIKSNQIKSLSLSLSYFKFVDIVFNNKTKQNKTKQLLALLLKLAVLMLLLAVLCLALCHRALWHSTLSM